MEGPVDSSQQNNNSKDVKKPKDKSTATLIVLFVSLVLDLLAFTVILPILPALLDYYGREEDALYRSLKNSVQGFRVLVGAPDTPRWNSVLFGGLISSLFSFLQFMASPIIGSVSDVYGRKIVLLCTMVGIAAAYSLWAVASTFTLFVISRILGGISKGNVSLSIAVVADVSPPEKRGRGMALIGVAFSVGFIVGPMIGAYFSKQMRTQGDKNELFFTLPAIFALTLAVLDIIFIAIFFKETLPVEKRAKSLKSGMKAASDYLNPVSLFKFTAVQGASKSDKKSMQQIGAVYFLYMFIYSGLEMTLTFLTYLRFDYDSLAQGKMFFFIGLIMVMVQGGYVRRLKQGTEWELARNGIIVLIPAFIIIGVAYSTVFMFAGLLCLGFGSATVVPCLTTLVSSCGTADQKGTILGIFRSLGALARAIGPIFFSTLYWCAGPLTCYLCGSIMLAIPLVQLMKIKHTHKE